MQGVATNWMTDVTLSSRMVWRGIDFASSPSLQGLLAYKHKRVEVGALGIVTTNGSKEGFGNTLEVYATYNIGNLTLTVDDYFFFNAADSLNNYFDWRTGKTQHFVEARARFAWHSLAATAGYVLHKSAADHSNGLYLEAEYSPTSYLTFTAGGVTAASGLNFQTRAGITNVSITAKRTITVSKTFHILTLLSD